MKNNLAFDVVVIGGGHAGWPVERAAGNRHARLVLGLPEQGCAALPAKAALRLG